MNINLTNMLQQMKNIEIVSPILTIRRAWKEDYLQDLDALVAEVQKNHNKI